MLPHSITTDPSSQEFSSPNSADAAESGLVSPTSRSRSQTGNVERSGISSLLFTLAGLVMIVAVAVMVASWFEMAQQQEFQRKSNPYPSSPIGQLQSEQLAKLNEYAWVNREKGLITIPLERAIDLTLERLTKPVK